MCRRLWSAAGDRSWSRQGEALVSGEWVTASKLRYEVDKDTAKVLEDLESAGWQFRRQGHKAYAYCPCGEHRVRIDGTPKNPTGQARRVKKAAAVCEGKGDSAGR